MAQRLNAMAGVAQHVTHKQPQSLRHLAGTYLAPIARQRAHRCKLMADQFFASKCSPSFAGSLSSTQSLGINAMRDWEKHGVGT